MTEENERRMNELAAGVILKQVEALREKCSQPKPDENNETGIKGESEPPGPTDNTLLKK